jgi:4-hydroxy-tetrahydrodipicolinate reductase
VTSAPTPAAPATATTTKIGLLGATGRMGQWVSQLIETEYAAKAKLLPAPKREQPLEPLLASDVVIDFSSPAAMIEMTRAAVNHTGPLPAFVVGSTGWKLDERGVLEALAKKTPVLMASNFSTGVLALIDILRQASPLLEKLGYTPVIRETHHKHKKDSPSGTALSLQRAIAPAGPGNVQTFSVRAGEIVGDHEVTYYGPGDHITIGHFAQDRSVFARGAIDVALWLATRRGQPGATGSLTGIEKYFEELKKT